MARPFVLGYNANDGRVEFETRGDAGLEGLSVAETQKSSSPVAAASALFILAAAALAYAIYYVGGVTGVRELLATVPYERIVADVSAMFRLDSSDGSSDGPATPELDLPKGMTPQFALRLWQEQLDSQKNIRHLVDGDMESIEVGEASYEGTSGEVVLTVRFKDGSSASGRLVFTEMGDAWYVSHISGLAAESGLARDTRESTGGPPATPLPALEDVDVGLLNAMIEEQRQSQAVFRDYLEGNVKRIVVKSIDRGPGTTSINVEMVEVAHNAEARIIAISDSSTDDAPWFLARFQKLRETPKLQ